MVPYLIAAGMALLAGGCLNPFWKEDPLLKEGPPKPPPYPLDRNRTDRKPEAGRVQMLEGLTLEDFDSVIPTHPDRQSVLQELNQIIADDFYVSFYYDGKTNPKKIDPLWETIRAARLFQSDPPGRNRSYPHLWPWTITGKDINKYQETQLVQYWDRHREKVGEEFKLSQVDHPFVSLLERLEEVVDLTSLRGLPAYDRLGAQIPLLLPSLAESRKLQVLYPGSGFHIAPLLTAMRLIESGIIAEATYVFTEIKPNNFKWLTKVLQTGPGELFETVTIEPKREFPEAGSEQTIVVNYKGHPIRIVFALNRSGENYYRREHLEQADLIVIHDPGHGAFTDSFALLAKILLDKQDLEPQKPQAVIMEGNREGYPNDVFGFPPEMRQILLPGPYGHCVGHYSIAEIEFCDFDSARAFLLNNPGLMNLAARYGTPRDLSEKLFPSHQEVRLFKAIPPR